MSFDAKLILAALDKHFDAIEARWDRFFSAQDQRWAKQVVSDEHHFQVPISTEQSAPAPTTTSSPPTAFPDAVAPPEGAGVGRDVLLASRVVPTAAGMVEILDTEPTDEIRNGFVDIVPTDEIRSDGCLTPAVVVPTESVACTNPEPGVHISRCGALQRFEYSVLMPGVQRLSSRGGFNAHAAATEEPASPTPSNASPSANSTVASTTSSRAAIAAMTFGDAVFISSGSEDTTAQHVVVEDSTTRTTPTRCSIEGLTRDILPKPICVAPISTLHDLPTRCSMQVHSSDHALFASPTSFGSSLGTYKNNVKVSDDSLASYDWLIPQHMYISTHSHAYSVGVMFHGVILVHCGYEVFTEWTAQFAKLPLPSLAMLVDIVPWPPPLQSKVANDRVQLKPDPWPSLLEYSIDVHKLHLLPVVFADYATIVQALGFCQINIQFKAPWPPPDWTWGSGCQNHDWYIVQKNVVGYGLFILRCCDCWPFSHALHQIKVLSVQLNYASQILSLVQQLFQWDPGGGRCLLDEFESIDVLGNFHMLRVDLSCVKKRGWMILIQFLSSDSSYVVSADSWLQRTVSALLEMLHSTGNTLRYLNVVIVSLAVFLIGRQWFYFMCFFSSHPIW